MRKQNHVRKDLAKVQWFKLTFERSLLIINHLAENRLQKRKETNWHKKKILHQLLRFHRSNVKTKNNYEVLAQVREPSDDHKNRFNSVEIAK